MSEEWRPTYEILSEKYPHLVPEHEPLCIPNQPCYVRTPYGELEGLKCQAGSEINHNTRPRILHKIAADGELRPGERDWVLGQDTISLSSCPAQHYGGYVKLVFDTPKLMKARKLRPMCYFDHEEYKEVDRKLDEESSQPRDGSVVGSNRVKARYGAAPRVLYPHECEWLSDDTVPLKGNLKRIEYWVPGGLNEYSTSCGGPERGPSYANRQQDFMYLKAMKQEIKEAKDIAGSYRVPFKVKSCFPLLATEGWGRYVELDQGNLDALAEGKELSPSFHMSQETLYSGENSVRYRCRC